MQVANSAIYDAVGHDRETIRARIDTMLYTNCLYSEMVQGPTDGNSSSTGKNLPVARMSPP